jgi:hypothetical protein
MTFPIPVVEVGFTAGPDTGDYGLWDDMGRGLWDTATWAPDNLWTDVTRYVRQFSTRRGAARVDSPMLRYEAGTSTATLNNADRRFDPTNLAGPYVAAGLTQVTPMRAVRYRAVWAGATYELWSGNSDAWQISYVQPAYSSVILTATDAFKTLAAYSRVAGSAVGAGENTGARVARILNSVSWPANARVVAVGDSTLQATTLDGDALAELQLAADSELGEVYADAGRRVVFRNRRAILTQARSAVPVARFGDGAPNSAEQTTVNLHTNPSVETGITGWIGGGFANQPSVAQSSAQAQVGTKSVLATWATATQATDLPLVQCGATVTGLRPGSTYTFSLYARVPAGSPDVFAVIAAVAFGSSTGGLRDQWVRLTCTAVVSGTSATFQVWPVADTTAGQQVYLDGAQVEEGGTATAYTDGDQTNSSWDGPAHASTSRRTPELPYEDVTIDYDDTQLANLVRITRVGGATQTTQDVASQGQYLIHTYDRDDLIVQTDTDAANIAGWLAYQSAQPELRFATLTINPRRDPDRLYPQVLGREVGDRIAVVLRPPGGGTVTRDVFIRGITHDVDAHSLTWRTTFALQSATKYAFGMWDSNTLGLWDESAFAF